MQEAGRGETIAITRHGEPAALLVPVRPASRLSHDKIVAGMRELRDRVKSGKVTVRGTSQRTNTDPDLHLRP